jgi:hypothetical protein
VSTLLAAVLYTTWRILAAVNAIQHCPTLTPKTEVVPRDEYLFYILIGMTLATNYSLMFINSELAKNLANYPLMFINPKSAEKKATPLPQDNELVNETKATPQPQDYEMVNNEMQAE